MNFTWLKLGQLSANLPKNGLYTFLNPFSYTQARLAKSLFSQFDRVMLDGQLAVWYFKLLGFGSFERQSFDFSSIAGQIFSSCELEGKSIYLIGAKESEISDAANNIANHYPKLKFAGFRNGYFINNNDREITIKNIIKINPDVIVVGMGTPIQEQFLVDLRDAGWIGLGFTCGGFLHQTARSIKYYPTWINKLHLRWLFRMKNEPKLIKRYLKYYPLFLIGLMLDRFRSNT